MRNIAIGLAVVIFAGAVTACAYAQVSMNGGAVCTKSDPVTPTMGKAQTIKISADIASTVSVKLSATKVAWKVTSAGTYTEPIINIVVKNPNGHDVAMNVAGAGDLKNTNGKAIDTFYGILANWRGIVWTTDDDMTAFTASAMCPHEPAYQKAVNFNGSHKLSPNYMSTLWNKIVVDDKLPTGEYKNNFTVTFSEQL